MINDPKYSWESGYQPYCLRCDTMYRMRRNDDGWKCMNGRCGLQITKEGASVPDGKTGPIKNPKRSIIDSLIETRYSQQGPSDDWNEEIRRIREAGDLFQDVLRKSKNGQGTSAEGSRPTETLAQDNPAGDKV